MKKFTIIAIAFVLVSAVAVAAFNAGKGEPKSREGITELPLPGNDSLLKHGEELVNKAKYSNVDLEALKIYLNKN